MDTAASTGSGYQVSGSQGYAIVAGHGLHIDFVEEAGTEQLAVRRAVQGYASGEALAVDREVRLERGVIVADSHPFPLHEAPTHD